MLYMYFMAKSAQDRITERGAGMAEYALLLALIAVALIVGFQGLATSIGGALGRVVTGLAPAAAG